MAIRVNAAGQIITRGGLPSCTCCEQFELAITYDWRGTGQSDLDTQTAAFSETVGWSCGDSGTYVAWLAGGNGNQDDTSQDGFERVDVRVDQARADELWTSSYNIECSAGWFSGPGGSGGFVLSVSYKGNTKSESISDPGESSACASTPVATITVYAAALEDGTFFEITVL